MKNPIFIVGCTNSGTKCLLHTLIEHPDAGGLKKELHFFGIQPNLDGRLNRLFALYPCFNTNFLHKDYKPRSYGVGPIDKGNVEGLIQDIFTCYPNSTKKGKRLLIKDPKLSLRLTWIKELWPDAHIIAIVRNPWAVIEGIVRKLPLMGDVPLRLDVPTATAQWINVNTILSLDSQGMTNFQFVKYEDMIKAKKFPNGLESNCFWSRLLGHLDLPSDGFTVPNSSKYSNFEQERNDYSFKNLSKWDRNFISMATESLIERFGYQDVRQKVEAM